MPFSAKIIDKFMILKNNGPLFNLFHTYTCTIFSGTMSKVNLHLYFIIDPKLIFIYLFFKTKFTSLGTRKHGAHVFSVIKTSKK